VIDSRRRNFSESARTATERQHNNCITQMVRDDKSNSHP